MAKGNHHALLMEILIAVLFFALASTVILNTFATAHSQSRLAGITADALVQAQNLTEQLYAQQPGGEEEFLAEQGFVPDGEGWTLDCGDYVLIVTADDGFSAAEMRAVSGESELLRLPYAKYSPIEVSA